MSDTVRLDTHTHTHTQTYTYRHTHTHMLAVTNDSSPWRSGGECEEEEEVIEQSVRVAREKIKAEGKAEDEELTRGEDEGRGGGGGRR